MRVYRLGESLDWMGAKYLVHQGFLQALYDWLIGDLWGDSIQISIGQEWLF